MRNRIFTRYGFIAIFFIIISIALVSFYFYSKAHFDPGGIEINKAYYPITGFDVSKHTGKIDFKKLKKQFYDTLDFVYIKATEGVNLVDNKFEYNYLDAKQNDLLLGFYHFFKFNMSGKEQAKNFLQVINDKAFELPLVLDVEEWSNSGRTRKEKVLKEIRLFIDEVESITQKKVMIYTNESSYLTYIQGNFESNKIWICSFSPLPKIPKNWTLWQHSHRGKFNGAEGWIDLNTFNGSRKEWNQFLMQ